MCFNHARKCHKIRPLNKDNGAIQFYWWQLVLAVIKPGGTGYKMKLHRFKKCQFHFFSSIDHFNLLYSVLEFFLELNTLVFLYLKFNPNKIFSTKWNLNGAFQYAKII